MCMDNNEAVATTDEVEISTITYCASLLRVSPQALLLWMVSNA